MSAERKGPYVSVKSSSTLLVVENRVLPTDSPSLSFSYHGRYSRTRENFCRRRDNSITLARARPTEAAIRAALNTNSAPENEDRVRIFPDLVPKPPARKATRNKGFYWRIKKMKSNADEILRYCRYIQIIITRCVVIKLQKPV